MKQVVKITKTIDDLLEEHFDITMEMQGAARAFLSIQEDMKNIRDRLDSIENELDLREAEKEGRVN